MNPSRYIGKNQSFYWFFNNHLLIFNNHLLKSVQQYPFKLTLSFLFFLNLHLRIYLLILEWERERDSERKSETETSVRERESERERGSDVREKHWLVASCTCHNWGLNLKPCARTYMGWFMDDPTWVDSWAWVEPTTFWSMGQCSNQLCHPARAIFFSNLLLPVRSL